MADDHTEVLVARAVLARWLPGGHLPALPDEMDSITRLAREVVAALHQYHQEKP